MVHLAVLVTRRDALLTIEQTPVTVQSLAVAFGMQRITAQAMLLRLLRHALVQRSWDGRRFTYSITQRGVDRLAFWDQLDAEEQDA